MRAVLRDPQLVAQLVEVPTIVSYSWLQPRMEQKVDIPVPGRGGRISGLQGFHPRQNSTARRSSEKRPPERIVEQIVDIPGGGLQDFRPGPSSSSSSRVPARAHEALDAPGEGVFGTFLLDKKVRSCVHTRGLNCSPSRAHPRGELMPCPWFPRWMNSVGGGFRGGGP